MMPRGRRRRFPTPTPMERLAFFAAVIGFFLVVFSPIILSVTVFRDPNRVTSKTCPECFVAWPIR